MQSFSVFSSGFFFIGVFCPTDFADDADFFHRGFFSSDFTEFIRRFPAEAITHGFSRMRPVRSLQIPPEVGKSPTDFTDLHRFWTCSVFGKMHADFADDADFFVGDLCFFVPQISQIYTDSGLVRSLKKNTQISQMTQILLLEICVFFCPTDFTDLHRFWTCSVFGKKTRRFRR